MPIYTGVADSNGDFTVPFLSDYTSGQKVTVTAEKDGASKSIELFAPSNPIGEQSAISITGSWDNFPQNIGTVQINMPVLQTGAFWMRDVNYGLSNANGLILLNTTNIGAYAFYDWRKIVTLSLPSELLSIGINAFQNCFLLEDVLIPDGTTTIQSGAFAFCSAIKKLTLGASLQNVIGGAFMYLVNCNEIICRSTTPPNIASNTFDSLNSACVFKVPTASLTSYQSAPNWSVYASRMVGI